MARTANISVPTKTRSWEEEGKAGVTLWMKAHTVYSKSAGDKWDLEQAVMRTPGDPWEVLIIGVGGTKHMLWNWINQVNTHLAAFDGAEPVRRWWRAESCAMTRYCFKIFNDVLQSDIANMNWIQLNWLYCPP